MRKSPVVTKLLMWHSVSERPEDPEPEPGQYTPYLIAVAVPGGYKVRIGRFRQSVGEWRAEYGLGDVKVVWWAEMPELPGEPS